MGKQQFIGKNVYITGASAGIGKEMAKQICAAGGRVALFARRKALLDQQVTELNSKGQEKAAVGYSCDVTDRKQVLTAFAAAAKELGPCDVLIANAGTGYPVRAASFDGEAAADIFRLNVFGMLYAIEAVLPEMIRRKSGHIVGLSSLAAFRSYPESHPYCASKAAVSAHLEGLRPELMPYGIAVTTLCPGFIKTDLTAKNKVPMPMILEVEEGARRMLRAVARKKRRYIFPLPVFLMVYASRWLPDRFMAKMTKGKSYKDD